MTINTFPNYEMLSEATANLIIEVLKEKPDALICIASGDTPLGVCKFLAQADKKLFENAPSLDLMSGLEWMKTMKVLANMAFIRTY